MAEREWLDSLKPGDNVIVESSGSTWLRQVDRVTKTLIIVGLTRFTKRWGMHGSGFDATHLYEPTDEKVEKIVHERLVRKLKKVDWKSLDLTALHSIWETVEQAKKAKKCS